MTYLIYMNIKTNTILFGLFITFFLLTPSALAETLGPAAFMEENVEAYYDHDGSFHEGDDVVGHFDDLGFTPQHCIVEGVPVYPCRYGLIDVGVPTNMDVLQDIRLNVSDTTETNLEDETAFQGALSSPEGNWERSRLYFDTERSSEDRHFDITDGDSAPVVQLTFDWENERGGEDLFSKTDKDDNASTMIFTATLENTGTADLDGIQGHVSFAHDDEEGTDAAHITTVTEDGTWTATPQDSTGTGYDETLDIEGSLTGGGSVDIVFEAEMEEGEHYVTGADFFHSDDMDVELDDVGVDRGFQADYNSEGSTFTGRSLDGKFSRGPIREGVDLADQDGAQWGIRGFIENIANNLTYEFFGDHHWGIYEVDDTTGELTMEETGKFLDGEDNPKTIGTEDGRFYTTDSDISTNPDWVVHEGEEKPYYASEFQWEVVWNETDDENYFSSTHSSLDMPELHVVKMAEDKDLDGVIHPGDSDEQINVTDRTWHTGSEDAKAEEVEIHSIVPGENHEDEPPTENENHEAGDTFFEIDEDSFQAFYTPDDGQRTEITDEVTFEYTQPTEGGEDGHVNLTINDVSGLEEANDNLGPDDEIELSYSVRTNIVMEEGDGFDFGGQTTYVTESGTDYTREHEEETIVAAAKRLTGFKDLYAEDEQQPTVVSGDITVEVIDDQGDGIDEIEVMDYIPKGVDFDENEVSISGDVTSIDVEYVGEVTLPDGTVADAYRYSDDNGGWSLGNAESFTISYDFNITTPGSYEMPTTIAGFDPATGTELGTESRGFYRLRMPEPELDLVIDEGEMGMVTRPKVGDSVEWMLPVEVYNPNSRPSEETFEVEIPEDVNRAWVTYTYDGETYTREGRITESGGENVFRWEDSVPALDTRRYEVRLLTPPVSEVDRSVEVLEELPDEMVKIEMEINLRNFASTEYDEVLMNLPIPQDNIIEATDAFGEDIGYTGTEDTTTLIIEDVPAKDLKTLVLTYKQPYPTIIVTPEQDIYEADGPVDLRVLVINGGEKIDNPKIELALYSPEMRTVFSEVKELDGLEPLEETEMTETYILDEHIPEGEYLAEVRFREDFATLATGTGKFYVESAFGPGGPITTILILLAIAGAVYVSYKRIKSIRGQQEV